MKVYGQIGEVSFFIFGCKYYAVVVEVLLCNLCCFICSKSNCCGRYVFIIAN